MLFALRPAIVSAVCRSSGVPAIMSRPGSTGGRLPQVGKPVDAWFGSWGGASPSTTRNCTAFGLRSAINTGSENASKKTRLYASGKSPAHLADIVLIAAAKVVQPATNPAVFRRDGQSPKRPYGKHGTSCQSTT